MLAILLATVISQTFSIDLFIEEKIIESGKIDPLTATFMTLEILDSVGSEIDPLLIIAMMDVESKFDPLAISSEGARGILQVMPSTKEWVEKKFMIDRVVVPHHDPVFDITVSVSYVKYLMKKYRDVDLALIAYNSGPSHLDEVLRKGGQIPDNRKRYPALVKRELSKLKSLFLKRRMSYEQVP